MSATQVQLRRGAASQVAAFTGAPGEVVVDTTNNRVVVQDGSTVGGFPAAKLEETVTAISSTDGAVVSMTTGASQTVSIGGPGGMVNKFRNGTMDVWQRGSPLTVQAGGNVTVGAINALGAITGGTAYTNGTYTGVPLTGGSGSGAVATIVVSGGVVASVTLSAVGLNYLVGDTLSAAASSIGGTGSGFSVPVSTLQSLSASGYTADGWMVIPSGASVAVAQVGGRLLTAHSLQVTGASSVTDVLIKQRIEGRIAAALTDQVVTVQAQINNNTGGSITPTLTVKHAGSQDNWGSPATDVNAAVLQVCANGVWTRVAYTFIASVSAANGLEISFDFGNNFGAGAKSVEITECDVRVTPGAAAGLNSVPAPPELRPVWTELAFNQRYYETSYSQGVPPGRVADNGAFIFFISGAPSSSWIVVCYVLFKTTKRAIPTIVLYSPASGISGKATDYNSTTDVAANANNVGDGGFEWDVGSANITSTIYLLGHWTASAEL